jgi:hypothetical protein
VTAHRSLVRISVALVAAVALLVGCAPAAESARPITTEESQLLAVVRFNNFNAGARTVLAAFSDAGTELSLEGWVDYETQVGYATLTESESGGVSLVVWDEATLAARPVAASEAAELTQSPVTAPTLATDWGTAPLSPQGALHPLLAILIALGNDRPDNPLLLQQGGALWLRVDSIGETEVTVFSGPTTADDADADTSTTVDPDAANARYWVDADGLLLRCEVRLGSEWVTIDLGPADDVHLESPFAVGSP